ncbi:MAG TPA: sugar ABC transporter substrate-binding protein [Chloroflexota bacterium]|nr:sugar ABC transporter substrate-binding protein [Chloroflexota bacterium]
MSNHRITRRSALGAFGALTLGALVAACSQSPPAAAPTAASSGQSAAPASTQPAASTSAPAATSVPAAAASSQGATKKFRYLYNATPGVDEQVHLDLIALYNKLYPDVQVEKIRVPNDAEIVRKLLAMLASHDLPDLFWNRQRTAPPFIDRGVLLDLSPLIAADKMDIKDFWPSAIQTYGRNGKLYGLPNSASSNAHYYNLDLFAAAGLPDLKDTVKAGNWNWDTLRETATKLTKGSGPTKQFGFNQVSSIYSVDMYIWQNGGTLWDDQITTSHLTDPADVEGIRWLVDNVVKYKISPTTQDTQSGTDLFAGGRVAIMMAGRYELPNLAKLAKFKVGMVVSPNGPKANTTRGDDLASSILQDAPNRDNAWNFAKMWSSDDGQKIVLASRRSFTARRSFAQSDAMKQNLLDWEDLAAYTDGLERTKAYRAPAQTGEVNTVFDRELSLMYSGEKPAEDGTAKMKQDIDVALKKPL